MGRKATTIEEQISRLSGRGMVMDLGEEKCHEILMDIGYYRLGFYWNPFEIDADHNFEQGTKLSDVLDLYYLDVDLRNVLIKYLNRIEINLRTKIIYIVSNHYKNKSTWFADPEVMDKEFLKQLPKYYNDRFISNNEAIKKHHAKYINDRFAPAWKTLEFLPFGSILEIYRKLRNSDLQTEICEAYGMRNRRIFSNYIKTLLTVRNICAHGGQLFDFNTPKGIKNIPGLGIDDDDRHSFNGVLKLIAYFLGVISENRKNEFDGSIIQRLNESKDNPVIRSIIETKMGFKFV